MRNNTGRGGDSQWEVKEERLASMQVKIKTTPKLLSKSAGHSLCSIFRVPQSLRDANESAYKLNIVSIGPYHHGEPQLQMIQEHKWRFLGALLVRTETNLGLSLKDYLKAIQPLQREAREYYSEYIHFNMDEFIEMLVLDGCFIIELFRRFSKLVPVDDDDPITSMSWISLNVSRDLIRVENQIPFFILQRLFEITRMPWEGSGPSLSELALNFFNGRFLGHELVSGSYQNCEGKHLLDLLRSTFIAPVVLESTVIPPASRVHESVSTQMIPSISKLHRTGIKLKVRNAESFLVVKFQRGVIQMPKICMDDFMCCFMANCVAFEQCHPHCTKHVTTYFVLLDCLINTSEDVESLCKDIIENYLGSDAAVAEFVNNLGKDVAFDIENCYLTNLFIDVHEHYKNDWCVQWASFKNTYFSSPWSFISALAAFVALVLTVLQTFYTIKAYIDSTAG